MLVSSSSVSGCVLIGLSSIEYNLHVDKSDLGIVIFHPYTLLGGSCDDPVVLALFRQASAELQLQLCIIIRLELLLMQASHALRSCSNSDTL